MRHSIYFAIALFCVRASAAPLQDAGLQKYFAAEVEQLESACLDGFDSLEAWEKARPKYREQLFEMLSLSPRPEKTDLNAVVTGRTEHDEFVVENLHFQSLPGLYVTANLYLPKKIDQPLPAILYVCGHGPVKLDGVSYGNKVTYQHHGEWFARNGYVCLTIDTIQLGEIEGLHHGTYREGMWWWNSRGYTPAGVEAWNSIRALDYLETRPEVDKERFGVTGRSGGGAYSWWVTALDDRIKASAPVAGITDLRNHVIDGVVEGHCDCMFIVNTYRWDYPLVAALAAPRPLLIANSDKDTIFPLDGVVRTHAKVANIYQLYDASDKLGLLITEGPHKDTQDLQLPVFRWFNRFLKGEDPLIEMAATKLLSPRELKVFEQLPPNERTSTIHDTFVPVASEQSQQSGLVPLADALRQKVFRGWPDQTVRFDPEPRPSTSAKGRRALEVSFNSQEHVRLPLYVFPSMERHTTRVVLHVLDETSWSAFQNTAREFGLGLQDQQRSAPTAASPAHPSSFTALLQSQPDTTFVFFAPRGIGPAAWSGDARKQIQIRRRFMLVGQTLDSMRVWDIQRALHFLSTMPEASGGPREARASGPMAVNLAYAALFSPQAVSRLHLENLPATHAEGPDYLNVLRITDIPRVLAALEEMGIPNR